MKTSATNSLKKMKTLSEELASHELTDIAARLEKEREFESTKELLDQLHKKIESVYTQRKKKSCLRLKASFSRVYKRIGQGSSREETQRSGV